MNTTDNNQHKSTFDFSGDLEWAAWNAGVMCATCNADGTDTEAIGVAITQSPDRIQATPVCETCATDIENVAAFRMTTDMED